MRPFFPLLAAGALAAANASAGDRTNLNFDADWRFLKADPGAAAAAPEFADASWQTVSAPHTYNDTDTFDNWSNPAMTGETEQWGGRTWYHKTFTLPAADQGRKAYIEFEGVRQVGEVYLNGHRLGACKNGFIPFGFDLTPYLRWDAPNVLAVMCDNRFMVDPAGEANLGKISAMVNRSIPEDVDQIQANQIPWNNARWHPPQGGIYRNVYLHVTDPLHISLPLYDFLQTEGPYVYASEVSDQAAQLHFEVPVENGRAAEAAVEVEADVVDASGRTVLSQKASQTVAAGGKATLVLSGSVEQPLLWEPDYPYLYQVVLHLRTNGEAVDSTAIPFGIRTVRFTVRNGFFINGHSVRLHGWGQRPTDEWPGLGTAQPDWVHDFTMLLEKHAGSNFLRWGHSAGGPGEIEEGDRLGFITDQPGVDGESDTVGAAWKIRTAAFRDLLIYYRNHPSILIWEAGNQKVTQAHAIEMRQLFLRYDPHGGRSLAYRRADQTDAKYMDIGIGTEGGREIRNLPVVEGEYDREESPRRVWDRYSPPDFGYKGAEEQTAYQPYDSEDFAAHEVSQYVTKVAQASSCGGANWVFSDSTSGGRVSLETARDSGEVDGVRLPKEAYYVCAAMFRRDPQVHIIGHWTYPAGTKKTMFVAANGDEVELLVNGHSLGRVKATDRYLFTFPKVAFEPGEITAIAYRGGQAWAKETLRTAGPPVALRVSAFHGPGGLRADGSDIAFFDVEAVDAKGERCPTFQRRVDFDFSGPGTWRGGWNSGKEHSINERHLELDAGVNRVAVRAGLTAGELTVTAHCAGLKDASATVTSEAFLLIDGVTEVMPAYQRFVLPAVRPVHKQDEAALRAGAEKSGEGAASTVGKYIATFSYSGTVSIAHVETGAADGRNIYVDKDSVFQGLPAELKGADWVQAGQGDSLYSALDFIVVGIKAGTVLSVAHDLRLPMPSWLAAQFKPTGETLTVNGHAMAIYRRTAAQDETITLGSNSEDPKVKAAQMYIVFAHGRPRS